MGERNELLNTGVTAPPKGSGAIIGTREDIVLHHANAILNLIGVKLVPLISG